MSERKTTLTNFEMLEFANEGYGDDALKTLYNDEGERVSDPHHGDTLSEFVVIELLETAGEIDDDDPEAKFEEASRVIQNAINELEGVLNALAVASRDYVTMCAECQRSNGPHYTGPCEH